jgi:hypothetical protein
MAFGNTVEVSVSPPGVPTLPPPEPPPELLPEPEDVVVAVVGADPDWSHAAARRVKVKALKKSARVQ